MRKFMESLAMNFYFELRNTQQLYRDHWRICVRKRMVIGWKLYQKRVKVRKRDGKQIAIF